MPHTPLTGEQHHAVDRNPDVQCDDCGHTDQWENAKQSWSYSNNPNDPFLCPHCSNERFQTEMRGLLNHEISEYGGGPDDG